MSITPKQKRVLDFLIQFQREKGYTPSYREIADAFQLKSRGTAQKFVERLRLGGFLEQEGSRNVTVKQNGILLPLLGKVAAGVPIDYKTHQEYIEVPSNFLKSDVEHFCLKVQGDSMILEGILDQDHVVIRRQNHADNSTVVVASVNGEATLKKFFRKKKPN